MPVARKPGRKDVSEADVLKVIGKGLDVQEPVVKEKVQKTERGEGKKKEELKPSEEDEKETTIILRIKTGIVRQVDNARGKRRVKTPRNTWLIEAVLEKLEAEKA